MIDAALLSETLEALSDTQLARRRSRHLRPLKGLRGTPLGEVARVGAAAWHEGVSLYDDDEALHQLFCTAHEDGLLAIGLAAAAAPDAPEIALALAGRWLAMVDDLETADALGWVLYGPALLAAGEDLAEALLAEREGPAIRRRAAVMAALAAVPEPLEGPSVAPLRERVGQRHVAIVEAPLSPALDVICTGYRADDDPHVRKALARVLRLWGGHDPGAVEGWIERAIARGGVPRFVREQAERGIKRGRRGRA